jgi:Ca2+-binding RTX toxin-like protein
VLHGGSFVRFSPVLDGGPGDDTLSVNNNGDGLPILHGGAGDDDLSVPENGGGLMYGDAGDDDLYYDAYTISKTAELHGGTGSDDLTVGDDCCGPTGLPVLDGGDGPDTYSFESLALLQTATIVPGPGVDTLDQHDGTEPLDFDMAACPGCVERVIGSPLADHIAGDAGAQTILGGDGDDVIDGGGGIDILSGQGGDDAITSRDGIFDSVGCGDGTDSVLADRFDVVARDCETVSR